MARIQGWSSPPRGLSEGRACPHRATRPTRSLALPEGDWSPNGLRTPAPVLWVMVWGPCSSRGHTTLHVLTAALAQSQTALASASLSSQGQSAFICILRTAP